MSNFVDLGRDRIYPEFITLVVRNHFTPVPGLEPPVGSALYWWDQRMDLPVSLDEIEQQFKTTIFGPLFLRLDPHRLYNARWILANWGGTESTRIYLPGSPSTVVNVKVDEVRRMVDEATQQYVSRLSERHS